MRLVPICIIVAIAALLAATSVRAQFGGGYGFGTSGFTSSSSTAGAPPSMTIVDAPDGVLSLSPGGLM